MTQFRLGFLLGAVFGGAAWIVLGVCVVGLYDAVKALYIRWQIRKERKARYWQYVSPREVSRVTQHVAAMRRER